MQALTGTAAPAVAKGSDEEWEEYHLTPSEKAEVEAVARAPKKIQRAILEEDLKASMRSSDKDLGGDDEDDEDRRRQERMFDMRDGLRAAHLQEEQGRRPLPLPGLRGHWQRRRE